jgi:hypothetical protein
VTPPGWTPPSPLFSAPPPSIRTGPVTTPTWAPCIARRGDLEAAVQAYRSGSLAAPDWFFFPLQIAEIEELRGAEAAAREAYLHALSLWPDWAPLDYWQGTDLRRSVFSTGGSSLSFAWQKDTAELENSYKPPIRPWW